MDDIYVGKFLDQRYEILERIGTGGMAVVYKGLDHRLNRLVAIKILKADMAQNDELRKRFHAEGQAVAMLSHPNIVAVYDVNRKDNVDYIVMELIEGITLKQYINRKGILNWKEALHFSTQIAKALGHAHSRGIVHRDIKPQNIMVLKDGSVKVADFGIARLLATQNTLTQEALGSVHYISPEQAKGEQVDARSDIYSLGVVMYEMLTSRLPFEGESAVAIAIQHISSVPLEPRDINPDIPKGLAQITMHAMEQNLSLRYKSADEMVRDLEEFRKDPSVEFSYSSVPTKDNNEDSTRILPSVAAKKSNVKRGTGNAATRNNTTKEEYRRNRRSSGATTILIGAFLALLLVIGIGVYVWRSFGRDILSPNEERIAIPKFIDFVADDVINNPENSIFNFTVREAESETVAEGIIISQDPADGRNVILTEDGINITLIVSSGPKVVNMPDLINKDYREAKNIVENLQMDLDIVLQEEPDESITAGYVMEQFPAEGTQLNRGTTVYITYSSGPAISYVDVPGIVGKPERQAQITLESYELTPDPEYVYSDEYEIGYVIYQSLPEGESVPIHTRITYQVSMGKEPAPQTTTPTTPTTPVTTQPTDNDTENTENNDTGSSTASSANLGTY